MMRIKIEGKDDEIKEVKRLMKIKVSMTSRVLTALLV